MEGSILSNIRYGDPNATDEMIIQGAVYCKALFNMHH